MAVDQARNLNFFRDQMLSINGNYNNPIQIARNLLYSNNSNLTNSLGPVGSVLQAPAMNQVLRSYNLNDVALQQQQFSGTGKFSPVKDDSGVTFNNSLVPPPPPLRKRPRDLPAVLPAPNTCVAPSLLTVPPSITTATVMVNKESSNNFSFLGEDISLQMLQHQLELDRFICQHLETMRMEIEDRKKQQFRRIMVAIQGGVAKKLQEKEEEIEKIGKINWTLEERVKSLCLENQIWRDLAQTNEATANALRTNLEQVVQQVNDNVERTAMASGKLTHDAVSCCGSTCDVEEREGDDGGERWRKVARRTSSTSAAEDDGKNWIYRGDNSKRLCKKCGEGESSVLLLPCRHLCLCSSCGPTINACPVCNCAKNASVHVNLS